MPDSLGMKFICYYTISLLKCDYPSPEIELITPRGHQMVTIQVKMGIVEGEIFFLEDSMKLGN